MHIDINNLKVATDDAIAKGKSYFNLTLGQKALEKLENDHKSQAIAAQAILDIPSICQAAASKGKHGCCVFVEKSNFSSDFINSRWQATINDGPGIIILEACKNAGLHASTIHQDDGCGINSWAEIWVHW